jgi:putative ABC transport system ATP-binding protein
MIEFLSIIQLDNVSKRYMGEVDVFRNVNLQIEKKSFIVIRGRSGLGKSTLLRIIGLLDLPTSGKVIVNGGTESSKMNDTAMSSLRLRTIGFIFQQFNLIPSLTNLENVELPMELVGKSRSERKKRASELLESFGLSGDHSKRYPQEISVGEQQRVAIARAIANKPSVILADEPTASLDEKNSDSIMNLFRKVNEEDGVAVVMTTTSSFEKYPGATIELTIVDGSLRPFSA